MAENYFSALKPELPAEIPFFRGLGAAQTL
jgi:hypothetical protein